MTARSTRAPAARQAQLRDGRVVSIRGVRAADEPALHAFLDALCLDARRLRYFTAAVDLAGMARWGVAMGSDRLGLVALDGNGAIVGHAVAIELGEGRAEVAVEVADDMHGDGLGTILIERLAQEAERRGTHTFVAEVLPENRAMLDVFRDGFDAHVEVQGGVDIVELPTSAWRLAGQRFPEKSQAGNRSRRSAG